MIVAVDTGGTKTLVTSFDKRGKMSESFRFPTPRNEDEYVATLIETIHDNFVVKRIKIDLIVIAVPGVVKKNIAVWCPHTGWQNFDFAPTIAAAFDCPVWLENDANLAGLAETRALPTIPDGSLYVTVSTGIGTGIIIDGQIAPGLAQSEGGHIRIEYDGRLRDWDSFASGKAIVETYGKYAKDIHDQKTWKQIADKISRGLVTIVPILQPDVIIIGGSVGTYFERYETPLRQLMKEHMPPHIDIPLLRKAQHPEEAVVYGCYYYAKDKLSR